MQISEKLEAGRETGNGECMPAAMRLPACRGTGNRETADDYRGVILDLGRYRVAVCRDGLQWLYQRRRPGGAAGGTAWDTLGYCVTRAALMRLTRSHGDAVIAEIAALPARLKREGGR